MEKMRTPKSNGMVYCPVIKREIHKDDCGSKCSFFRGWSDESSFLCNFNEDEMCGLQEDKFEVQKEEIIRDLDVLCTFFDETNNCGVKTLRVHEIQEKIKNLKPSQDE
jgi:hypothetical protein